MAIWRKWTIEAIISRHRKQEQFLFAQVRPQSGFLMCRLSE
jgi:hypothetical protein